MKTHDVDLARFRAAADRAAQSGRGPGEDIRAEATFTLRGKHYKKGDVLPSGAAPMSELVELLNAGKISWAAVR